MSSREATRLWATVPICDTCWYAEQGSNKVPIRLTQPEIEDCHSCGQPTRSGIYVRKQLTRGRA